MIPKVVHYCWLSGGNLPDKFQKNLDRWKKLLPDFEFMLWDFNRFNPQEHKCGKWVEGCFKRKRYAWASDPIRLTALYQYGGIYMDLDVELVKPFGHLLNSDYILGYEYSGTIEAGIMGSMSHLKWIEVCLKRYDYQSCILPNGKFDYNPLPNKICAALFSNGFCFKERVKEHIVVNDDKNLYIFPPDYLSAKKRDMILKSERTYTIHHFAASSAQFSWRFKMAVIKFLGKRITNVIVGIKSFLRENHYIK